MKIFTFGDGFATGHLWPEWPQILQALLPDHTVTNSAGIGAGPEFLVSNFVDLIPQISNAVVVFQWPSAARFDKLLENNIWDEVIDTDAVYHFNRVYDHKNRPWWLSSASQQPEIKRYHEFYIQLEQQQTRLRAWQILVEHTCRSLGIRYVFTSTEQQEKFSRQPEYRVHRLNEVQPSPWVHLRWLVEVVLPQLDFVVDLERQQKLEKILFDHKWQAYDPDRETIWNNMIIQLNG